MSPKEFVKQVRVSIVEQNAEAYRTLLSATPLSEATDEYWRSLIAFHEALPESSREILYALMRQVIVDTVSNMFAVLDGVTRMDGQNGDVSLVDDSTQAKLSGSLQDTFLAQV